MVTATSPAMPETLAKKLGPAAASNVSVKIAVHRLRDKNGNQRESIAMPSARRQLQVSSARGDGRRGHRA